MSDVQGRYSTDLGGINNVTTRKGPIVTRSKMAHPEKSRLSHAFDGSLLIDSIMSQDEEKDVVSMMIMADEYDGINRLPSFCTSTQMGGRDQRRRPTSPPLSPLGPTIACGEHVPRENNRVSSARIDETKASPEVTLYNLKNSFHALDVSYETTGNSEIIRERHGEGPWISINSPTVSGRPERRDPLATAGEEDGVAMASNQDPIGDVKDGESADDENVNKEGDISEGGEIPMTGGNRDPETGNGMANGGAGVPKGDIEPSKKPQLEMKDLAARLETVDEFMERIDKRSLTLTKTVKDLEDSLTFSQLQIEDLKKENAKLKKQVGSIETEDRRTQFQVSTVEGKLDRLETATKRKNLLFEGIPESGNRREDVGRSIGALFDQISVVEGISFEACYRVGPYDKDKTRPILVSFEKQSDRDMIYARRFELKKTKEFQSVWINEDMDPLSKRKRSLIKFIAKEAQMQGVDCRSGKYSLAIEKKRFDEDNLDDLPPKLHPTQLKQVQIDGKLLAYQSEFAPFSNFYSCNIVVGQHTFFCLEQAFQFLRAKILEKPLAATRIYLSRDVYYIKQVGRELGTSDKWETRKFDLMYECLKKKFDQHPELKALLLKTGDLELVEATPDRVWGCGATLSSNVLRRHAWAGQNKHGEILMTIREEYRNLVSK